MKKRTLFIVVALVFGLAVFLLKWKLPAKKYLLRFNPYQVEGILLKNEWGQFRFEKKGGEWWIKEPMVRRAQQRMAGAIVARLVTLAPFRKLPPEANPALQEFGLVPPLIEVELYLPGQKERLGLRIGNRTPMDSYLYAQLLNQPDVYLFPTLFLHQLNQGILEWVERRWLPIDDGSQIQSIHVELLGDPWDLVRHQDQWYFKNANSERPISTETMTKIFRGMNDVTLKKILDKGTSQPIVPVFNFPGDLSLTYRTQDQSTHQASFYLYSGLVFTKDPQVPDQAIRIHPESFFPLLDLLADLRQLPIRPWRLKDNDIIPLTLPSPTRGEGGGIPTVSGGELSKEEAADSEEEMSE